MIGRRRRNKIILVIEDESILRNLLVMTLSSEGYTVYDAADGKEGLAHAFEFRPDMILLDIIMPEMNGVDMLKQLRRDTWGSTATVVLLTNLGDNESIEKAKAYDVQDYMVKSDWSLDELAQHIKERLGQ